MMIYRVKQRIRNLIFIIVLHLPVSIFATELTLVMTTKDGALLRDAVVELTPVNASNIKNKPAMLGSITQIDKTFIPFVTIIPINSKINFPNKDKTRHHVYSFSEAKSFQLRLYIGEPKEAIHFDKAGIVALGCNIHDAMEAYVYVTNSFFTQKSNQEGVIVLKSLPKGEYLMDFWHPWQEESLVDVPISITSDNLSIQISLDVFNENNLNI